jgi:hypothetical protein
MIPDIVQELLSLESLSSQQQTRILKVYNEEYYVLDHSITEDKINIHISGSSKSVYTISITKETGKIWCDCPDSKSHAARHNCICKHCCFVMLKIGKIYTSTIYQSKNCTHSEQEQIITRLNKVTSAIRENSNEEDDSSLVNETLKMKYLSIKDGKEEKKEEKMEEKVEVLIEQKKTKFDKSEKELTDEDECPICFDYLKEGEIKSCPDCHNYVHLACIEKWLQTKDSCILCRSHVLKTFRKDHNLTQVNKKEEKKNKNSDYLQL